MRGPAGVRRAAWRKHRSSNWQRRQTTTLESLKVGETVMTYEGGLADLTRLSRLKKLGLDKVGASEADIEKLRHAMPHTEIQWTAPTDAEVTQFRRWSAGRREHPVPGGEGMTHSGPRSSQESR